MSRTQIGRDAAKALLAGEDFKRDNTRIITAMGVWDYLALHGTRIAAHNRDTGEVCFSLAGWNTRTTRDRLNAVCSALGLHDRFHVHKRVPCFGSREINTREWIYMRVGPLSAMIHEAENRHRNRHRNRHEYDRTAA